MYLSFIFQKKSLPFQVNDLFEYYMFSIYVEMFCKNVPQITTTLQSYESIVCNSKLTIFLTKPKILLLKLFGHSCWSFWSDFFFFLSWFVFYRVNVDADSFIKNIINNWILMKWMIFHSFIAKKQKKKNKTKIDEEFISYFKIIIG